MIRPGTRFGELLIARGVLGPDELEEALGSERWQERALALEALQRRGSFGGVIEARWQEAWEADGLYHVDLTDNSKPKYYFL